MLKETLTASKDSQTEELSIAPNPNFKQDWDCFLLAAMSQSGSEVDRPKDIEIEFPAEIVVPYKPNLSKHTFKLELNDNRIREHLVKVHQEDNASRHRRFLRVCRVRSVRAGAFSCYPLARITGETFEGANGETNMHFEDAMQRKGKKRATNSGVPSDTEEVNRLTKEAEMSQKSLEEAEKALKTKTDECNELKRVVKGKEAETKERWNQVGLRTIYRALMANPNMDTSFLEEDEKEILAYSLYNSHRKLVSDYFALLLRNCLIGLIAPSPINAGRPSLISPFWASSFFSCNMLSFRDNQGILSFNRRRLWSLVACVVG
uniref:Uncharacterized protein n=1 Tax=Cannabis sativa TaxID=3483 RepID=A0A803Q2P9_CANSA